MTMSQWDVIAPDGTKYTVEAADENEAWEVAQEEIKKDVQAEYENMPWYQKAMTAATDEARIFNDALTMGMWDRASSAIKGTPVEYERELTKAADTRSNPYGAWWSGAGNPATVAGWTVGGKALPSGVRAVQKAVGGPAGVRAVTGTATAAGETAVLGGVESGARNEDPERFWRDVQEGAGQGAIFGPLGHLAGEGIKAGVKGYKAYKRWAGGDAGPTEEVLEVSGKKRRTKAATAREEAVNTVEEELTAAQKKSRGATSSGIDKALSERVQGILADSKVRASLHPDEIEALDRINTGDPAVRFGRKLAKIPSYAMIAGGVGGAGVANTFDPLIGGAMMTVPAIGMAGRYTANKGAQNLANEAMRTIRKTGKPDSSLKPGTQDDIYKILRMVGL